MKEFRCLLFLIFFLSFNSFNSNEAFAELRKITGEEAYKHYVLDRIDGPDTPEHVKKFANENNCYHMMRHYYWSYKIFKDNGGVYSCDRNNKRQYIYDNGTKLRFARWYEKYKFRKLIYGD